MPPLPSSFHPLLKRPLTGPPVLCPPPPSPAVHASHAFIEDRLFRSTCPQQIQNIINFFDTVGRRCALDLSFDKTKVHAIGLAAQRIFPTPREALLSTLHRHTQQPHTVYKYRGLYIYTNLRAVNTMDLIVNENSGVSFQPSSSCHYPSPNTSG